MPYNMEIGGGMGSPEAAKVEWISAPPSAVTAWNWKFGNVWLMRQDFANDEQ